MTEPSPAAKRKACELANAVRPRQAVPASPNDVIRSHGGLYALALRLDFEDQVGRETLRWLTEDGNTKGSVLDNIRSLMLPDPPDVLEEIFRYVSGATCREGEDWNVVIARSFRAELARTGYKLVKESKDG